jgi:hypothetical protein
MARKRITVQRITLHQFQGEEEMPPKGWKKDQTSPPKLVPTPSIPTVTLNVTGLMYIKVLNESGRLLSTVAVDPNGLNVYAPDAKLRHPHMIAWKRIASWFKFMCEDCK